MLLETRCPNCRARLINNYDEVYCLTCSYRDYSYIPERDTNQRELLMEYKADIPKCLICGNPVAEGLAKHGIFFCSTRCRAKKGSKSVVAREVRHARA